MMVSEGYRYMKKYYCKHGVPSYFAFLCCNPRVSELVTMDEWDTDNMMVSEG